VHGPAQALPPNAVALAAQGSLYAAHDVATLMAAEDLDQYLFLSGRLLATCLLLSLLPRIVAASWHRYYLAKQAHGVLASLRFDKAVTTPRLSVTEKMAMAFLKFRALALTAD
jgi:hypothetical protein